MIKRTIIISLLSPASLIAQRESVSSFDTQAGFYADAYDVVWTMPDNMTDMDTTVNGRVRKEYRVGNVYRPVLESRNHEFILMYSNFLPFITDFDPLASSADRESSGKSANAAQLAIVNAWPRSYVSNELQTAYGYRRNVKLLRLPHYLYKRDELKKAYTYREKDGNFRSVPDKEFRFEDYVTIVSGKRAQRWFNADTVFLYTLPVDDPYKEGYTHCTGMVISKKDRAGIGLKLYFTDQGKKKEGKYLRSLRKKIWYRNDAWTYDKEIVERAILKHYGEDVSDE